MEKENNNRGLTGYQFLMLYSAILFKQGKSQYINKLDLEEKLYSYSINPNYSSLFGSLIQENSNNNDVVLSEAFNQAEKLHLLEKRPSSEEDPTYEIVMMPGMDEYIISTYSEDEVKDMKKIVNDLNKDGKGRS